MAEEIRPLTSEAEVDRFVNMVGQAFRGSPEQARRRRGLVQSEELRGLLVDGEVRAALRLIAMPLWFGAAPVGTGGLSAVATPPEYRRQGYIGRLLRATLAEIRGRGWPLSALYPFSFPFYKRYGWEHVTDHVNYTFPIERLPMSAHGGTWHAVTLSTDFNSDPETGGISEDDLATLMGLYDAWVVGQNGPMVRNARWWRLQKLAVGRDRRPDVYIWRDGAGRPRAYVVYAFENLSSEWHRRLQVWDWAALDATAFRALLQFLRNHDSQAAEVRIAVPEATRFLALFDNPEFKVETEAGLMLRLVDVPAALAARLYPPEVQAAVTLAVTDPVLEWNNGTFALTVADGRGQAEPTTTTPGLSLDQRTLVRLYSGYLTPAEAAALDLLTVHDPAALEAAGAIFAGPRPAIFDFF
jgi:predicted acetyltransferase